jgi:hypothetical protein
MDCGRYIHMNPERETANVKVRLSSLKIGFYPRYVRQEVKNRRTAKS